jgi:hypothetical protein
MHPMKSAGTGNVFSHHSLSVAIEIFNQYSKRQIFSRSSDKPKNLSCTRYVANSILSSYCDEKKKMVPTVTILFGNF